jgi:hypothetical protein
LPDDPAGPKHGAIVRITGFLDFVHLPEYYIIIKHKYFETGFVSISWRKDGATTLLGVLESAK